MSPAIAEVRTDAGLIEEARDRWNRCDEAEDSQRNRILLAKQFRAGNQWPEAIKIARSGGQAITGLPQMPQRPCLVIDRLSQPARHISNQIKTANFAIDVLPNGFGADTETAAIFKGYLRYVQNKARGESPIEWAADGSVEGGLGWFRIRTEYVYDSPEGVPAEALEDQEIRLERISNNLTVYCDPWAMKPTRSDAQFMFVTEDLSKKEFARRWPKADLQGLEDFSATGDCPAGWVEKDSIRIAEYWRIIYETQKVGARTFKIPRVKMSKITATQELEKYDWAGSRIPLVPILGEELNIDGRPYLRGIIEPGMDAQRMVNYTYSGAVEIFALGSKAQFIAADDQVADYKHIWETANTYNWAYLPYKPMQVAGSILPPPARDTSEAPIQAAAMLLQVSEEGIKATTGWYDSGLGDNSPRVQSGRAKQSEIQQSELGSSNYPDNVRRALIYAGELMVELAPKITRPGQLLQILGMDDKPQQVIVGQPFVEQNGQAKPIQDHERQQYEQGLVKFYDFTKGRYAVTVGVGKSSATKREEGAAAISDLIPNLPPAQAAVLAPEYVENLSFEGSHKAAELMRKTLPPELQEQNPEDAQQQVQQLQQKLMQMQQVMQEMQPLADKNKADLMKAQLTAQSSLQEAKLKEDAETLRLEKKLAAEIAIARISAAKEALDAAKEDAEEALALGQEQVHEAIQNERDREHERQMQAQGHEQEMQQADQGAMHASQQAEQQAALNPPQAEA